MRKLALVFIAVSLAILMSGSVYALNKTNTASTEKIKVVSAPGNHYAIRIQNHAKRPYRRTERST